MPTFYNSTAMNKSQIMGSRQERYPMAKGGRVGAKDGRWIQKATENMRKDKPCTGKKFGSKSCPPGSKRYNLANTFKKMAKKRKG